MHQIFGNMGTKCVEGYSNLSNHYQGIRTTVLRIFKVFDEKSFNFFSFFLYKSNLYGFTSISFLDYIYEIKMN